MKKHGVRSLEMNKTKALKLLNPILGVLVLNQLLVGLLHDALPREVFEVMHEGGGILLVLGVLLHLILNWNWVRANFLKKSTPGR
jgi:hypothetical protein